MKKSGLLLNYKAAKRQITLMGKLLIMLAVLNGFSQFNKHAFFSSLWRGNRSSSNARNLGSGRNTLNAEG
ncbi:hypothetical protein CHS0354_011076 [Potamilus streckersoni]|uniref:Uncharacterized protein n=1 Tax=Potamilus streckersoni TaxID=2493646 RepID=A0AAE0TLD3_9BIVA|nr:hypothetical protein CHS0354_011076 [Potamilus streckersoni]